MHPVPNGLRPKADEQCDRLRAALARHVAWVRRLHDRMDRRRWRRDDPLYRQVVAARLEVERLDDLLMRISLIGCARAAGCSGAQG